MIDYDLLDRFKNGNQAAPPDCPTWMYVTFVCGLQFGLPILFMLILWLIAFISG